MSAALEHAARIEGIEQTVLAVASTQAAASALCQSLGFWSFGCERPTLKIGEQYVEVEHLMLRRGGAG